MRLLFVCQDMRTGGAERHWATLVPALADRGAEVRVVCLGGEGALFGELVNRGVAALSLDGEGRGRSQAVRRALAEAGGSPDVVVTRAVSPQLVGYALARRAGALHVLNEHTPVTSDGRLLPVRARQRAMLRLVAPRVDGVIAVAAAQVPGLVALGYRRERITVVPNGLFSQAPPAVPRQQRREALGLRDHEFAVLCPAGLRPEKRVDTFVEAVWTARERAPSVRGIVAGDGPERRRIEELVATRPGTTLLGERGDMAELMRACDCVCLPSEAEALPMSLLEAMALGRAVVSSDVGGCADLVGEGEAGLLIPAGDVSATASALVRLARAPEEAAAMGRRGSARQRERFTGEAMVEGYLRALGEVRR
jgi:glycosyltransferase involved in cell wall biosynthesis